MNSLLREILDPCQIEIIIRKGNASIKVTQLSPDNVNEQDLLDIKATANENSNITFNLGISKVGGTDNWGIDSDKIILAYNKGASEGDSILVDDIVVGTQAKDNIIKEKKDANNNTILDENGKKIYEIDWDNGNNVDWCTCERLKNDAILYTTTSVNNSTLPRVAYFKHQTNSNSNIITRKGHQFYGYEVLSPWFVTVEQEPNPELVEAAKQSLIEKVSAVTKEAAIAAAEAIINSAGESVVISKELKDSINDTAITIAVETSEEFAKKAKDDAEQIAKESEESPEQLVEDARQSAIKAVKSSIKADQALEHLNELNDTLAEREAAREIKKAEALAKLEAKEAEREAARNLAKSSK